MASSPSCFRCRIAKEYAAALRGSSRNDPARWAGLSITAGPETRLDAMIKIRWLIPVLLSVFVGSMANAQNDVVRLYAGPAPGSENWQHAEQESRTNLWRTRVVFNFIKWVLKEGGVPADAPPMFILAATDDPLKLAPESVALYQHWTGARESAELHWYSKGGHGFGMRRQNLPSDRWVERFADWLDVHGWLKK